jgi:hypothetical protein
VRRVCNSRKKLRQIKVAKDWFCRARRARQKRAVIEALREIGLGLECSCRIGKNKGMHRVVFFVLLAICPELFAQTNSPLFTSNLFSVPQIGMRFDVEKETTHAAQRNTGDDFRLGVNEETAVQPAVWTNSVHQGSFDAKMVSDSLNGFSSQIYERLEREGYLTRPELPSENLLVRFANATEPEVIHWNKISITSPVITAIKKKNPFCLINWIVLDVRW